MTPVQQLCEAATRIRQELPGDLSACPRLVMTDAETVSGIAFCAEHKLPLEGEHQYSACDNCAVVDCFHEKLAEVMLALLLARDPMGALLYQNATRFEDETTRDRGECPDCGESPGCRGHDEEDFHDGGIQGSGCDRVYGGPEGDRCYCFDGAMAVAQALRAAS